MRTIQPNLTGGRKVFAWANVYGISRTLLALATAGTLALSSSETLFRPTVESAVGLDCQGWTSTTVFCLAHGTRVSLIRWIAVAVLLIVATGWRPRYTGLLHWWIAYSVANAITIPDGGDQVSANLALLLIPVTLVDSGRWHWAPAWPTTPVRAYLLRLTSFLVQLQVAVVYLDSSIAKLGVPEWRDGSALYYWLTDPTFGAPDWATPLIRPVLLSGAGVLAMTWGPILIEFLLGSAILLPVSRKKMVLPLGLLLHLGIAILMGLGSFAMTMWAALLLYLWPWTEPLPVGRLLGALGAGGFRRSGQRPAFTGSAPSVEA